MQHIDIDKEGKVSLATDLMEMRFLDNIISVSYNGNQHALQCVVNEQYKISPNTSINKSLSNGRVEVYITPESSYEFMIIGDLGNSAIVVPTSKIEMKISDNSILLTTIKFSSRSNQAPILTLNVGEGEYQTIVISSNTSGSITTRKYDIYSSTTVQLDNIDYNVPINNLNQPTIKMLEDFEDTLSDLSSESAAKFVAR